MGLKFTKLAALAEMSEKGSKVFCDLVGLADEWDEMKNLRNRVIALGCVVVATPVAGGKEDVLSGVIQRTVDNVKTNAEALRPLMAKMKGQWEKVPELANLMAEIEKLLQMHSWKPTESFVRDQAWSLRYLFGVVKHNIYKPVPPRDSWYGFIS